MTPEPSQIIVTNDGVTAPYYISVRGEHEFAVNAELPASDNISYIDVIGFSGPIDATDWPPVSNIESISIVDGKLRVTGSENWLPAPFELKFEVQTNGDVFDFYVRFV